MVNKIWLQEEKDEANVNPESDPLTFLSSVVESLKLLKKLPDAVEVWGKTKKLSTFDIVHLY
jgi:hypothetical protein